MPKPAKKEVVIEGEPPLPEAVETGLAIVQRPQEALGVFREPTVVLREAKQAAQALMEVVNSKGPGVWINGEQFLEYEDWLTLARFYSMTPVLASPVEECEHEGARGWKARVNVLLIPTNQVVGSAEAMCLRDEPKWSKKPSFQLMSMAQTRAGSKALASVLRWVVVLAGYKVAGTPAAEMNGYDRVQAPAPAPASQAKLNDLTPGVKSQSDDPTLDDYKIWLPKCPKMEELTAIFAQGYKQFFRDPQAQKELREIYEARKIKLGGTPNPEGKTKKNQNGKKVSNANGRN